MRFWRRVGIVAMAVAVLAAACGDDEQDASNGDETTTETTAETETSETTTEDATTTETTAATSDSADDGDDMAAGTVGVELGEWFVDTPDTLDAGTYTFAVTNVGENPHAFAIVEGNSYEELPQLDNGAIDTDVLGDAFLGSTDPLESGLDVEIEFELEAGNYVFFCPIQFGPNSHAAAGQVLSVTVE